MQELQEMRERVKQRPLLFERVTQVVWLLCYLFIFSADTARDIGSHTLLEEMLLRPVFVRFDLCCSVSSSVLRIFVTGHSQHAYAGCKRVAQFSYNRSNSKRSKK